MSINPIGGNSYGLQYSLQNINTNTTKPSTEGEISVQNEKEKVTKQVTELTKKQDSGGAKSLVDTFA
ncbi:hypothetical protein KAZ01_03420 [Candidatus Gracilibacteria bacterium]|nr:hypothetical protein [Candidatus Gracilibacteria bacterium]